MVATQCPNCASRAIGQVGPDQFYCWDCCIEWQARASGDELYMINEEGDLYPFPDSELGG